MKQNIREFFPTLILDIVGVFSVFQVVFTQYIFTFRQYLGLFFLFVVTILFFINRKVYQIFLLFILLIGTIGLISFSTYIITFGFSIFQIQLIPFLTLILYMYIYNVNFKKYFVISEDDKKENSQKLREKFKKKFSRLSDKEIEMKLEEDLISEAIEALKSIKNARDNYKKKEL